MQINIFVKIRTQNAEFSGVTANHLYYDRHNHHRKREISYNFSVCMEYGGLWLSAEKLPQIYRKTTEKDNEKQKLYKILLKLKVKALKMKLK